MKSAKFHAKSTRFHKKSAGFHEIRNERPIARNRKAYVCLFFVCCLFVCLPVGLSVWHNQQCNGKFLETDLIFVIQHQIFMDYKILWKEMTKTVKCFQAEHS